MQTPVAADRAFYILEQTERRLRSIGVDEASREARLMVAELLGIESSQLPLWFEHRVDGLRLDILEQWLRRRARREPLQYILGYSEFWGLRFSVSKSVLIPRPETEHLVEEAVRVLKSCGACHKAPLVCDLCTGSGCVAVSIAHEVCGVEVVATDISEDALRVAKKNILQAGLADRVRLRKGNLYDALDGYERRFYLITANPPYVESPSLASLQPEVRLYEPRLALDGGTSGLGLIAPLVAGAPNYLEDGGYLMVEIGVGQKDDVVRLFEDAGFTGIRTVKDYSGIDRVVVARSSSR